MNTARRVATVVAVVLGIAGGVTTARIAPGNDPGLTPAANVNDPRQLGIPLVSPGCSDKTLLVVGGGNSSSGLQAIVSDNDDPDLRYLRTDESCETKWSDDKDLPDYVIYRGPYDEASEPCRDRMASDPGLQVTQLNEGNEQWVNCGCVLPATQLQGVVPPARLEEGTTQANTTTVQLLQAMLNAVDESTGSPTRPVTGTYDPATLDRVVKFQIVKQIFPDEGGPPDGGVGERTWENLKESACPLYDTE